MIFINAAQTYVSGPYKDRKINTTRITGVEQHYIDDMLANAQEFDVEHRWFEDVQQFVSTFVIKEEFAYIRRTYFNNKAYTDDSVFINDLAPLAALISATKGLDKMSLKKDRVKTVIEIKESANKESR